MAAIDPSAAVLAVGALGTASYALVDCTKVLGGGVSYFGFGYIKRVLRHLFPKEPGKADKDNPIGYASVVRVLYANWINGTSLSDQKSIAKTLIKLRLSPVNAPQLAKATGVDPDMLKNLAQTYVNGDAASTEELNVAGRFDLILTALLDEGYQRADQMYRNGARGCAVLVSIGIALVANAFLDKPQQWPLALVVGLLAAPLAPVSKDLASALQAGVKAMQAVKK